MVTPVRPVQSQATPSAGDIEMESDRYTPSTGADAAPTPTYGRSGAST